MYREMNLENKNHLRMQVCISTIIDVHQAIAHDYKNEDFFVQFGELKKSVDELDIKLLSEGDVLMVEQATNALLEEFRTIFEFGEFGPVYNHPMN